jgi:hypothetical protein
LLSATGGFDQDARAFYGAPGSEFLDFARIIIQICWGHDLDSVETGTIVYIYKGEAGLGVSAGSNPSFDRDFGAKGSFSCESVFNSGE